MTYTPVPGGKERVDRERQEADRRYHEVFAGLDRIVNDAAAALPSGDAAAARLATFHSVLVQFLQQITPYIDTKVRAVEQQVADIAMTAAAQRTALAAQRTGRAAAGSRGSTGSTGSMSSEGSSGSNGSAGSGSLGSGTEPAEPIEPKEPVEPVEPLEPLEPVEPVEPLEPLEPFDRLEPSDSVYVGFEDLFRGSESEIRSRQADYVPLFSGASDVLDVGCGRGEFLVLLKEAGIGARGIDLNEEMVAACRNRGLQVERVDAVGYLRGLPDESLGGLFAAQVVEHLQPHDLAALLREAARVLRPGARLVLETINPACWLAFFESYIRDLTHAKPLHPDTLKFLAVASGFRNVEVRFRSPIPDDGRLRRLPALPTPGPDASRDAQVLAQLVEAFNLNMERLNDRMFTHLDYAVVGVRA